MRKLIRHAFNFFCTKEVQLEVVKTVSPEIVKECMAYLKGEACSDEIKSRIEHYLKDDPCLSKKEAVEMLMDFEERKLKS